MQRLNNFDCPVCRGSECRGGGNLNCIQRDPRPSHIAGILDSYGGTRVVVAHIREYKHHVRCGEFLCKVPGILVHTPIVWNQIPWCVNLGERAVKKFVDENEFSNDPEVREALTHYKLRKLWLEQKTLNLHDICYT